MNSTPMKAKHVRTGLKGEKFVMELLDAQGYEVSHPNCTKTGDLSVFCPVYGQHFNLEVKTANIGVNGDFKFCLYREGKTDVNHADILALVFKHKRQTYIRFIAVADLPNIKLLQIGKTPDKYNGKYAKIWHNSLNNLQETGKYHGN